MAQQTTPPAPRTPAPSTASAKPPVRPQGAPVQAKKPLPKKSINVASIPFWLGLLASIVWVGVVLLIVAASGPEHTFGGLPLVNWAIGISAIASPVALIWMVTAYLQRAADIQGVAEPLRRQLSIITGESGIAEARIRRFNVAIREQVELLKEIQSSSAGDFSKLIERVHQSRTELEQFEYSSIEQVRGIQEIIRRNMQQVEQLMDDKFTMMRVLDDKLVQSGDGVARQTEAVRDNIAKLLEEIEMNSRHLSDTLERAVSDSKKLSDTSRAQESSLVAAAENTAEILGSVSGKIDLSVARFLERAGTAREEAERLSGALDSQTRALDEFSSVLPSRVGETEVLLRGVADRLYDSEKLAREQATNLTQSLAKQVENLQGFMDQFAARLGEVDTGLGRRRDDLETLASRITSTAGDFAASWEKSVNDLSDRSDSALLRFTVVNDETRKNAEGIIGHLTETTNRYEDAATRMNNLTEKGHSELKGMTQQIESQMKQFDALREASHKMGEEVEGRAAAAMQNLQYVLDRLLAAREATQTVGETLVKDLFRAVDQNETLISRLNEAAQMSVRALGIATESLGKQEGDIITQTRAAEQVLAEAATELQQKAQVAVAGLKEQTYNLTQLLAQAQVEMEQTDAKIQSFALRSMPPVQEALRQVDAATDQGLASMSRYGDGVQQQLGRLQDFSANIGNMGEDLTRMTAETVSTIEQIQSRFSAARATQQDAAQQTLVQFADLSDRLQREIGGLEGQSGKAVTLLQEAAASVGEQSYQMLQTAETSSAKIQLITAALQGEATQIRATLQKQADDLNADLSRAEKQFATLGEAIQQRTDAAYSLLDRVADHYNDTTSAAAQNLDARTERLSDVTGLVQNKVEALTATLGEQLSQLTSGSTQLEGNAAQITGASSKALQQLTAVNEKLTLTNESANRGAQQTIAKLEETSTSFMRQTGSLSEAAQNATNLVQKAGIAFGEQTGKITEQTRATEQLLRQLTVTTASMAEQSAQIRSGMEQHNQRLVAQLTEAISLLEASGNRMQQTSSQALTSADQVASRFGHVAEDASAKLSASNQNMQDVANRAESALAAIGMSVTQQASSLSVLAEQLAEQQKVISGANEAQRAQLVDLFDKLGAAHGQASEVADRTIARLTESLNQIQRQLGALSDQSQTTVGNVRTAGDGFAEQATRLIQNAQQAEQQASTVLSVTAALQEQARQLRESLHGESDRAGDMLGGLISKLTAGGIELRDISSNTEMSLASLHNSVAQQSQGLNTTMAQIGERQRSLTTALDAQRDVLNGLLNRLALAQDEAASSAERTVARLSDSTQQVSRHLESLESQSRSTIATVQTASTGFAQEATTLGTHATAAEQQVRALHASTAGLAEQTRQMRDAVQSEGEKAGEAINALLGKLMMGGAQMRDLAGSTEASLVSLQSGLSQQTGEISGTMQQIVERQKTLTSALFEQREVMTSLLNRLLSAQDETATTAERTVSRLSDGAKQILEQIASFDGQIRTTLANVEGANGIFAQEANVLSSHAREAEIQARAVASTTGTLAEQARQARETIQSEGERAGELLTSLVNKLLYSGNQVSAVTSSTEATLAQLNTGLSNQSVEITSAMHQIIERQKVLTAALTEQRDMMGSLLNRVALAQDESAAAAERTVVRLADGAQQIVKQLEAIGTQASTTLTNVQNAGRGFADEAGNLGIQAQQAEQHMRGVLSVMGGLQDQSSKLRDAMQSETARVIGEMNNVIAQLEATNSQLKQQSGQAIHTMDQSALQFANLAKINAEAMHKQAAELNGIAEASEARMAESGEKIKTHLKLVGDVGTQTEVQARQLADVAEYATNRLGALRGTILDSDRDGQNALAQASSRIEEVKGQLQAELARLIQMSGEAVSQVTGASQQLLQQSDVLRSNLASSESALNAAATLVRDESVQVPVTLDRSTSQIEAATRILKSQAGEADSTLISTADRFISVTTTARESMVDEMRRIGLVAENASDVLQKFTTTLSEQVTSMKTSTATMSVEQKALAESSGNSVAQLTAAAQNLTQLRTSTLATAEKLAREFETIDQRATSTSNRLEMASVATIKNVEIMSEAANRAEAQMLGATNGFREQLERIRVGLQGQIDDINRGLMQITAQLERTGNTLRSTTAGTVADVERISQRFNETSMEAGTQLEKKTGLMRGATEEVAQLLSGFGDQLDVLLDRLSVAGDGIKRHEGSLIGQMQTALTHLGGVAEKLEEGRTLATEVTDVTVKRLADVMQAVQQQMATLTSNSQTAAGIMRGVGQMVGEQTGVLNKNVGDAHVQVMAMNKSVDDMQARTDRMRVALKLQSDELMEGLEQILQQLSHTGDALTHTVDSVLQEKAAENLKKIG